MSTEKWNRKQILTVTLGVALCLSLAANSY